MIKNSQSRKHREFDDDEVDVNIFLIAVEKHQ